MLRDCLHSAPPIALPTFALSGNLHPIEIPLLPPPAPLPHPMQSLIWVLLKFSVVVPDLKKRCLVLSTEYAFYSACLLISLCSKRTEEIECFTPFYEIFLK